MAALAPINCVLCGEGISPLHLMAHIPRCYRKTCIAQGYVPLCTCNSCEALRSHSGDTLNGSISRTSSSSKREAELPQVQQPPKEAKIDIPSLTLPQKTGKKCIFCGQSKSPSGRTLPIIFIGRYMKFLMCKKGTCFYIYVVLYAI